eukprot:CAMPEP_0176341822 /NCGR_PEP_ID=MMETSP0126-20121128/2682_1 /TAXON_ID=141414 ORGANISM="Strombidinopsis acuminatum, Strain SPMC142" /NCGR_SAMPLE_ID=MMETSP0126 /ASSEMBLY_ACC=CAM_ASM_000229 /LENGTH=70 /DNA_ID=CAMNT_0017686863 /DNA_START=195 /DNA_END=404 /DNA_ORIENTATION=+
MTTKQIKILRKREVLYGISQVDKIDEKSNELGVLNTTIMNEQKLKEEAAKKMKKGPGIMQKLVIKKDATW